MQTLQKNETEEQPPDRGGIDVTFRQELRRRIAQLHESVCETQELMKGKDKEKSDSSTKRKKKHGKSDNQGQKPNVSSESHISKKEE